LLDPPLATLPAKVLWERYQAEVQVAEIAHGFPAANNATQINALDLDIDIAENASWFYNQWQMHGLRFGTDLFHSRSVVGIHTVAGVLEASIQSTCDPTAYCSGG
jgi:hypothetical protein